MTSLQGIRDRVERSLRKRADVIFPERSLWADGSQCQFSITDLTQGDAGKGFARLQTDPLPASLRLLRLAPGSWTPALGSHTPYQGGTLHLGLWSDESAYTSQHVGICRLVDERVYPLYAVSAQGYFRVRIMALDAAAVTTGSNDLQVISNNSHRGYLPPGVRLDVGEVLTTSEGDQYEVVPPVQRDALGDTVGLSWQRGGAAYTPPPAPEHNEPAPSEPTPAPTPAPDINPDDRWWKEGL